MLNKVQRPGGDAMVPTRSRIPRPVSFERVLKSIAQALASSPEKWDECPQVRATGFPFGNPQVEPPLARVNAPPSNSPELPKSSAHLYQFFCIFAEEVGSAV